MAIRSVYFETQRFSQAGVPLTQLPSELTFLVLEYLSSVEIAGTRRLCKRFWKLASDETLWGRLFARDFPGRILQNGLPVSIQYQFRYKTEQNWKHVRYRSQIIPTGVSWSLGGEIAIDDQRIVCEMQSSSLRIWNFQNAAFEQAFEGSPGNHIEYVMNEGNLLISYDNSGHGGKVKVWNKTTGQCLWQHICYPRLTINGDHLIGAIHEGPYPNDSLVVFWNKHTGIQEATVPAQNINSSTLILEGPHIIFGNFDGVIKIYHKSDAVLVRELKEPSASPVTCLILTAECLIAGHANGAIHVWNKLQELLIKTLASNQQEVASLLVRQDLLVATYASAVIGWDLNTGLPRYTIEGAIRAFLDGDLLFVSMSESGAVEIRNSRNGALIHSLTGDPDFYASVVHVDPSRVFTRAKNGITRIWNKQKGLLYKQLLNIDHCTVLGDRLILALEGRVEVWDFSAT